ncbi:MAG: ELM1/GtrOC1 family putative glycosyltransferase [Rickettsiaceae bacterium]|nr:ELM1/GtrOC1 family putative glycosyltransferase [Rickettsiaceae bacterium]
MQKNKVVIWVLTDSKIGSNTQALALAEYLALLLRINLKVDVQYTQINVKYNYIANLPNFFLPFGFYQVASPDFRAILSMQIPDLIISASRKTAFISASMKRIYGVKNIHILKPGIKFSNFNLIVVPYHDSIIKSSNNNIINITGALCNLEQKIQEGKSQFYQAYPSLQKVSYLAVLIGGATKDSIFSEQDAKDLASIITQVAKNNNLNALITFSRRTQDFIKNAILSIKNDNILIYDPAFGGNNPYPAMISDAKFVIATCDSVSMCSEVVSSGKPLYIYIPKNFHSKKHLSFASNLFELGVARKLSLGTNNLQDYHYTPLNEVRRVAEYVISNLIHVI